MSSVELKLNSSGDEKTKLHLSNSLGKVEMSEIKSPLNLIFDGEIPVANLREKFLYNTFEIIAEKGAEALSASELIKKTQSSKGALFHHFETIDHLCIESLNFFKRHLVARKATPVNFENLDHFLNYFVQSSIQKQATHAYTHLTHFFRDRAIRDIRYRDPLRELFEVNLNFAVDRVLQFLAPGVSREVVYSKVVFMAMTVERICYYRVLYENQQACQEELTNFIKYATDDFKKLM